MKESVNQYSDSKQRIMSEVKQTHSHWWLRSSGFSCPWILNPWPEKIPSGLKVSCATVRNCSPDLDHRQRTWRAASCRAFCMTSALWLSLESSLPLWATHWHQINVRIVVHKGDACQHTPKVLRQLSVELITNTTQITRVHTFDASRYHQKAPHTHTHSSFCASLFNKSSFLSIQKLFFSFFHGCLFLLLVLL